MLRNGPDLTVQRGSIEMSGRHDILFLSGPPLTEGLWRIAAPRAEARTGGRCEAASVLRYGDGWRAAADALAQELRVRPRVVVAHGLALPAAIGAAAQVAPPLLVLVNGPLTELDPVHAVLARAARGGAGLLAQTLLRPGVWLPILASSVALRRAVVNPYAMDRDIVDALAGPLVADASGRAAVARWWGSLAERWPDPANLACPLVLAWGDEDRLYPAATASALAARQPGIRHVRVPGARWLWPEERPWAVVDALEAALA
jgi:pimeloyl-ACP methyl ester carboxylesterase